MTLRRGEPQLVKILVVDRDATVQRSLTYALHQEGFEVEVAANGADALKLWSRERASLVVVEADLPRTDGFAVVGKIRETEAGTHTPIILLTGDARVEAKVKALRAGADDYLVKPFHPAELIARVKGLLARFAPGAGRPHAALGRVIAFYGAKGGVGTTTIAINTAIALHRDLGRKVALVDANLQFGDHRVFLDLGLDRKGIVDVASAPQIDHDLIGGVLVRHASGVQLLLGPTSPETAELVTADHMPPIVDQLRTMADVVVLDLDRRLDETALRVLDHADSIYVVMTADLACLKNVRLLLETIERLGYPSSKVQLVLNHATSFTGVSVKNAEKALKREIAHELPSDERAAIAALNAGQPMVLGDRSAPLAEALIAFAGSVDRQVTAIPRLTATAGSPS